MCIRDRPRGCRGPPRGHCGKRVAKVLQRCGEGVANKCGKSGHRCGQERAYMIDVWRPPQG
eukprot:9369787-Alexandrium_andersonii.AAC.1